MLKSIAGSLIGIAIVLAADTLIRIVISIAIGGPVMLFRYDIYPGILLGLSVSLLTLVSSFLGAAFTITYADTKKKVGAIAFFLWLVLLRYGQIHLVMEKELFIPILSLILSLIGGFLAWKFFLKKKPAPSTVSSESENSPKSRHHGIDSTQS